MRPESAAAPAPAQAPETKQPPPVEQPPSVDQPKPVEEQHTAQQALPVQEQPHTDVRQPLAGPQPVAEQQPMAEQHPLAEPPAAPGPQHTVAPAGSGANPTPGLLVASVGALLTFLAAFLVWATVEVFSSVGGPAIGGGSRSVSGLEGDRLGKATLVVAIAALLLIGLLLAPASRRWGWAVLLVCGVLIAGLALLDLVSISDASDLRQRLAQVPGCGGSVQCSGDRRAGIGVWLTIAGGAVIVLGAAMHGGLFAPLTRRLHRTRTTSTPAA
jgi:hypothetical protein